MERQRELCERLASDKGWTVGGVYVENDLSAYSGKPRPEYERMLTHLENGVRDAVLVVDQDRLTRHPRELEDFVLFADKLGVPLANVSGDIDLSTSDGRFRARIMGSVARLESEKKAERHKRQLSQLARKGGAPGGKRRYGYDRDRLADGTPTFVVIPEEAEVVRELAERFLAGESLNVLAKDLNERGIPTATGKKWRATTLTSLLTSAHIAGLRVHKGKIVGQGNWEPLVDRATWELLRKGISDPRTPTRKGRPPEHLLTGILKCSRCGAGLYHGVRTVNGRKYRKYGCSPTAGSDNCGRISIRAEAVEQMVTERVLDALDSPHLSEALTEADSADTNSLVGQIERAEESLERLAVLHFVEDRMSEREYLAARDGLEAKISELRDQLVPETPKAVALRDGVSPRKLWTEADTDTRREIIATVVEHVTVGPGERGGRAVDPDRLTIAWRA